MWGSDRWTGLVTGIAVFVCCLLMLPAAARADMLSLADGFLVGGNQTNALKALTASADRHPGGKPLPHAIGPLLGSGRYLEAETVPFDDIPSLLGAAPEVSQVHPLAEGFPGLCYVSGRVGDRTAALFVWGTNGMAQCLAVFTDREMLEPQVTCPKSEAIHARLRTPEGLRLGLTRKEVVALLGKPHGQDAARYGYARVSRLPATPGLLRRIGRQSEPGETTVMRVREVMIWFRGDHVVGFSVEQHSHYN